MEEVTATKVVVLEEAEDEGAAYFFQVDDDRVLYLQGQHVEPENPEASWPNSHFRINSTPASFRIECLGDYLKPGRTIKPENFDYDTLPNADVFVGDFDRLEDDLRKLHEENHDPPP